MPKKGSMQPKAALILLLLIIVGFTTAAILHQYHKTYSLVPLEISPEILAEKARSILGNLGYTDTPGDAKYTLEVNNGFLAYASANDSVVDPAGQLRSGQPYSIYFVYRRSPRDLVPWQSLSVTETDPPLMEQGMINVHLDTRGRLIQFIAVPDPIVGEVPETRSTDWGVLFDEAGLEFEEFEQVGLGAVPPVFADTRAEWQAVLPEHAGLPVRIEAAGFHGRPVFFKIFYPWDKPAGLVQSPAQPTGEISEIVFYLVFAIIFVGSVLLARFNIKCGRGDLRGTFKLTVFSFLTLSLAGLILADYFSIFGQLTIFYRVLSLALYMAALIGIIYVALEPFARQRWSELLISWNRLLTGDYRDPMIGRDILIGAFFGISFTLIAYCGKVIQEYVLDTGDNFDSDFISALLNGWSDVTAYLILGMVLTLLSGLATLFLLLLFQVLFNNKIISAVLIGLTLLVFDSRFAFDQGNWIFVIGVLIQSSLTVLVLVRYGILATIFAFYYQGLSNLFPLSIDTSSHLFPGTVVVFAVALGLAIYGFYSSSAGEPVFGEGILREPAGE